MIKQYHLISILYLLSHSFSYLDSCYLKIVVSQIYETNLSFQCSLLQLQWPNRLTMSYLFLINNKFMYEKKVTLYMYGIISITCCVQKSIESLQKMILFQTLDEYSSSSLSLMLSFSGGVGKMMVDKHGVLSSTAICEISQYNLKRIAWTCKR